MAKLLLGLLFIIKSPPIYNMAGASYLCFSALFWALMISHKHWLTMSWSVSVSSVHSPIHSPQLSSSVGWPQRPNQMGSVLATAWLLLQLAKRRNQQKRRGRETEREKQRREDRGERRGREREREKMERGEGEKVDRGEIRGHPPCFHGSWAAPPLLASAWPWLTSCSLGASSLVGFPILAQISIRGFFIRVSELDSASCQTLLSHWITTVIPSGAHGKDA